MNVHITAWNELPTLVRYHSFSIRPEVLHKERSGRIAHLTFRRTNNILNTNESVRN